MHIFLRMSDSANCNIYGKLVKWNKKAHQQTHDPERLFSYTQYNKSFFVEAGLRNHQKIDKKTKKAEAQKPELWKLRKENNRQASASSSSSSSETSSASSPSSSKSALAPPFHLNGNLRFSPFCAAAEDFDRSADLTGDETALAFAAAAAAAVTAAEVDWLG